MTALEDTGGQVRVEQPGAFTCWITDARVDQTLGSGRVQLFVVPFCVISTFAVAEPSYVTTSRRESETGDAPSYVSVAVLLRIVLPAVG